MLCCSTIVQMLQQGFDANSSDYDKRTGLMLASAKGHIAVMRILLIAGANVNAVDHLGDSAIMAASKSGHDEALQ